MTNAPTIPFPLVEPREFDDIWTQDGACKLAARLFNYWFERGHIVHLSVQRETLGAGLRVGGTRSHYLFVVRSDMINGFPRRKGP